MESLSSAALFDRIASRDLRSPAIRNHQGSDEGETWILENPEIRAYLPSLLRLLRDADDSNDLSWEEDEYAHVVDKLMEIAVRYPMADAIEEYLCVSNEVGRAARRSAGNQQVASAEEQSDRMQVVIPPADEDAGDQPCTVLRFESGTAQERARLVQGEVIRLVHGLGREGGGGGGSRRDANGSGDDADLLDRTSFQQELGCLLPLLMMYCPGLSLHSVTEALLLHSKLAPAHLQVLVQNEPLSLPGVIKGVARAVQGSGATGGGSIFRHNVVRKRAQDTCVRLASLSTATAAEIRAQLLVRKQLPEICVWISLSLGDLPIFIYSLVGQGSSSTPAIVDDVGSPELPNEWFWGWTARLPTRDAAGANMEVTIDCNGGSSSLLPPLNDSMSLPELLAALWTRGKAGRNDVEIPAVRIKATAAALCFSSQTLPWASLAPAWKGMQGITDRPIGLLGSLLVMAHARRKVNSSEEASEEEGDRAMRQRLEGVLLQEEEGEQSATRILALYLVLLLGARKIEQVLSMLNQLYEAPVNVAGVTDHMRPGLEAFANLLAAARQGGDKNFLLTEGALMKMILSLPISVWRFVGSSFQPTALTCLHETMLQGLLVKHKVDLRDSIVRLLQEQPTDFVTTPEPDPSALPLLLLYSSACCLEHTPLPAHPPPFTMQPLLPKEVYTFISPLFILPLESIPPSVGAAARATDLFSPLTPRSYLNRTRQRKPFLRPSCSSSSRSGGVRHPSPCTLFPELLALTYALRFTQESQRCQGPFPPPFNYDIYALPIPHILSIAREGLVIEGGRGGWPYLYEKLVGLVLDHFPDLHPPEALVGGDVGGLVPSRSSSTVLSDLTSGDEREVSALSDATKVDGTDEELRVILDLRELLQIGPTAWKQHIGGPEDVGRRWLHLHGRSPYPTYLEKQTLHILLEAAAEEEAGPGLLPLNWKGACQEPLLVLRAPPWVFTTPGLLRIALRLLRSLMAASRVQTAKAAAMNMWKRELLAMRTRKNNGTAVNTKTFSSHSTSNGGVTTTANAEDDPAAVHPSQSSSSPSSAPAASSSSSTAPQQAMMEGPTMMVLQEAIVVKCLLSACLRNQQQQDVDTTPTDGSNKKNTAPTSLYTGTEVRHEVCLFLQHLLCSNNRALTVLVHRGLIAPEMSILMDGVPAVHACKSILGSLLKGTSLAAHGRGLAFITEFARRYQIDEAYQAAKHGVTGVMDMLGPVVLSICYSEGEDVIEAIKSIGQSMISLVTSFPVLRGHFLEVIGRALQGKDMADLRPSSLMKGGGGKDSMGGGLISPGGGGGGGKEGLHMQMMGSGYPFDQIPGLLEKTFAKLQQQQLND